MFGGARLLGRVEYGESDAGEQGQVGRVSFRRDEDGPKCQKVTDTAGLARGEGPLEGGMCWRLQGCHTIILAPPKISNWAAIVFRQS